MRRLTGQERASLRWMEKCNADRIGFLGPSLRKIGTAPELKHLVDSGLAVIVRPEGRGDKGGYWITEAGRAALQSQEAGNEG